MSFAEFYVTKGTNASNANGGGPTKGGNDGPVVTRAATSDGLGTTVTDDTATSWGGLASVDDWICFDTAGSKDFARITAVAGDNLTVSPAVTAGQAGKTTNVGGAWATVDYALSTVTTGFVNAAGDPPRINLKYESSAYNETTTADNAGTLTVPITLEGYESAAGDGCPNGNLPEIDADGLGHGIALTQNYWIAKNIYAHSTGAGNNAIRAGAYCTVVGCRGSASSGDANVFHAASNGVRWINCEASTGLSGFYLANYGVAFGCYAHDNSNYSFTMKPYSVASFCIADTPGDNCFHFGTGDDGIALLNCVGYNSTAGSGVAIVDLTGETQPVIVNCIFVGNNQYGIEAADPKLLYEDYNAFYSNSQGERTGVLLSGPHDVTLTGDPFLDAANGDFRLNATASAGQACKEVGFPGGMIDGTNRGYMDMGALPSI